LGGWFPGINPEKLDPLKGPVCLTALMTPFLLAQTSFGSLSKEPLPYRVDLLQI